MKKKTKPEIKKSLLLMFKLEKKIITFKTFQLINFIFILFFKINNIIKAY